MHGNRAGVSNSAAYRDGVARWTDPSFRSGLRRINAVAAMTLAILLIALLASCASLREADDLKRTEVVGEWKLEASNSRAAISMRDDGTFVARSWPVELLCSETGARTINDLDWGNLRTVRGTWQQGSEFPSLLILMPNVATCSGPTWAFDVWRDGGDLTSQVFFDGVLDPESADADQSVWITKVAEEN